MSSIVHSFEKGRSQRRIASGIKWVILNAVKGGTAQRMQIREKATAIGASRYVVLDVDKTKNIGLYTDPLMDDGSKGKIHSLSMLFLSGFMRGKSVDPLKINAVLMIEPDGMPSKRCVVFIQAGQITLDTVLERAQAIDQVEQHLKFSSDATLFLQQREIDRDHTHIGWGDLEELTEGKSSGSVLQSLPMSPYLIPAVLFVILCVVGGMTYNDLVIQPAKRQAAALEKAKQDHTPAYIAAADAALRSKGWDKADLSAFLQALGKRPMFKHGWTLDSVQCDLGSCTTQWGSRGGLVSDLVKDLPEEKLVLTAKDAGGTADKISTMDKSISKREYFDHKAAALARGDLLPLRDEILVLRPVLQKLVNASITINASEPAQWAVADLNGVRREEILMEQRLEISMPLFRAQEILNMLPSNVLISSVQVNVNDTNITVNLKGSAYARQ